MINNDKVCLLHQNCLYNNFTNVAPLLFKVFVIKVSRPPDMRIFDNSKKMIEH